MKEIILSLESFVRIIGLEICIIENQIYGIEEILRHLLPDRASKYGSGLVV